MLFLGEEVNFVALGNNFTGSLRGLAECLQNMLMVVAVRQSQTDLVFTCSRGQLAGGSFLRVIPVQQLQKVSH